MSKITPGERAFLKKFAHAAEDAYLRNYTTEAPLKDDFRKICVITSRYNLPTVSPINYSCGSCALHMLKQVYKLLNNLV